MPQIRMGEKTPSAGCAFDEFSISTSARLNLNGGNNIVRDNVDGDALAYWC
jgi:hypothetical protein